jgi:hypothetical protein
MYQRNVYEHVPIWKSITIEYRSDIQQILKLLYLLIITKYYFFIIIINIFFVYHVQILTGVS